MISKQRVMEWIEQQLMFDDGRAARPCKAGLAAALEYLEEPLMPADASDEMIRMMAVSCQNPRTIYQAMRTKLMEPPKPKMETVYCVAWMEGDRAYVSHYPERGTAVERRRELLGAPYGRYTCISEVYPASVPSS